MTNRYTFSIVRLDASHIDEICNDIREQYEKGIAYYPLFCVRLVPEGTPPVDKAAMKMKEFVLFRDRLHEMGIPAGILIQCTIGHGYPLNAPSPFRKYVNLNDGGTEEVCCPSDDGFCDYIQGAFRTLAEASPDIMMLDDDFRLLFRGGNGCACDWHMKRFNELAGTSLTREELFDHLSENNTGKYAEMYIQTQGEAILKAARAIRRGIDEVDPKLPCTYCAAGNNVEFGDEIAKIIAGEGNPIVIRVSNGSYVPAGARFFTKDFYRAATQIVHLRKVADHILAESDTCPHNRYALGASWFHAHYVGTILEGTTGAKHWITRLATHEPESGKAYRRILAKNRGFYEALMKLVPTLEYVGCRIPLHPKRIFYFSKNGWNSQSDGGEGWATHVLERMGLPLYFSSEYGGVSFFAGKTDMKYTDEEWKQILRYPVVLTSEIAKRLCERGFSEYLGVDVRPYTGKPFSVDVIAANGKSCAPQQKYMELVPLKSEVYAESTAHHTIDGGEYLPLFPSTTVYHNSLGGVSMVFAGDPVTPYTYDTAFSFLTESRKGQLVKMLRDRGCLPVYYASDEEVYLKAAKMKDGRLFCSLFNLSYDLIEQITLETESPVTAVSYLTENGEEAPCHFHTENGKVIVEKQVLPLNPVILFLK